MVIFHSKMLVYQRVTINCKIWTSRPGPAGQGLDGFPGAPQVLQRAPPRGVSTLGVDAKPTTKNLQEPTRTYKTLTKNPTKTRQKPYKNLQKTMKCHEKNVTTPTKTMKKNIKDTINIQWWLMKSGKKTWNWWVLRDVSPQKCGAYISIEKWNLVELHPQDEIIHIMGKP